MTNLQLAEVLRSLNSTGAILMADKLEEDDEFVFTGHLDLSYLELWSSDIRPLMEGFRKSNIESFASMKSISLNFNTLIGDEGIADLVDVLPGSIQDLKLVDCGIRDFGAMDILNWMNEAFEIHSVNLEQNSISKTVLSKFEDFAQMNPHILVTT